MNRFYPEGALLDTPRNQLTIRSATNLAEAAMEGRVVEARAVLCDAEHNLHVEMPCMEGIIPYYEGAVGIAEGTTRDIALISRVSKPVCFTVSGFEHLPDGRRRAVLSRRDAQERCRQEYLASLRCGDIIPGRITRLETFGAFCDIGCGLPALLPIDSEVIPMDTRARIMVIRLMDTIRKDPAYARSLGIEVGMKKQPACLMGPCPHAEGFTE